MGITSELLLTRHGQAHCNIAGVVGGPETWTALTDLGRQQVKALAARLLDEHERSAIAAVSSGPRLRLKESGHIVAEALELPLVMEAGLDGPHHGEADGRPWYEVKNAFPRLRAGLFVTKFVTKSQRSGCRHTTQYVDLLGAIVGASREFLRVALRRQDGPPAREAGPERHPPQHRSNGRARCSISVMAGRWLRGSGGGGVGRRRPLAADRLGRACSGLGPQSSGPTATSGT